MGIKLILLLGLLPFSLSASTSSIQRAWGGVSDPLIMSTRFRYRYQDLPHRGQAKSFNNLWSGHYWPLKKGNINYRWNSSVKSGFNLQSPTRGQALKMSIKELAALAPSEKYDLFTGRYDYPLKNQVSQLANPRALIWEGICHGWAPATINHEEPMPKLATNPDGLEIPFGSSDIKALLSYFYANGFESPTNQMGLRCEDGRVIYHRETCQDDLNPGAFHIVLANKIGLSGESFVTDIAAGKEVWNHPVEKYESLVISDSLAPSKDAAAGTSKVIRIKTMVYFIEGAENRWQTILGTTSQSSTKRQYIYDLELDEQGMIIGGEWVSKDKPDFLWIKPRPKKFTGLLSRLGELIHD